MSRYLIIDLEKGTHDAMFHQKLADMQFYDYVFSKEESIEKFREVWDASDRFAMKEEGYQGYEDALNWSEFSKTL